MKRERKRSGDDENRVENEALLSLLARALARKAVEGRWLETGKRLMDHPVRLNAETHRYLEENRYRLRAEAEAIIRSMVER